MNIAKIISQKIKHQTVFTTRLSYLEARKLYKFYLSHGFSLDTSKSKGHRISNANGYITFSPKEDYVHLYVRKYA